MKIFLICQNKFRQIALDFHFGGLTIPQKFLRVKIYSLNVLKKYERNKIYIIMANNRKSPFFQSFVGNETLCSDIISNAIIELTNHGKDARSIQFASC